MLLKRGQEWSKKAMENARKHKYSLHLMKNYRLFVSLHIVYLFPFYSEKAKQNKLLET